MRLKATANQIALFQDIIATLRQRCLQHQLQGKDTVHDNLSLT